MPVREIQKVLGRGGCRLCCRFDSACTLCTSEAGALPQMFRAGVFWAFQSATCFSIRPESAKSGSEMTRKCDSSAPHSEPLRVRLGTFRLLPHAVPVQTHVFHVFSSNLAVPRSLVKLLKGLDMGELVRSHSTAELLPLSQLVINEAFQSGKQWRPPGRGPRERRN